MTPAQPIEWIEELKRLAEKATPGPWCDSRPNKSIALNYKSEAFKRGSFVICRYPTRTTASLLSHDEWEANAAFIAASRLGVPKLIEALEVALDALRFLSCDGMDDGDFYDEEGIVEGTIMMANRARAALEKIRGLNA